MDLFPLVVALVLLIVVPVLVLVLAVVLYGRIMVRNQRRALAALRRASVAFLCRPTMGLRVASGFILSVDHEAVSLWKVGRGEPVRVHAFPSAGASVTASTVRINRLRHAAGLAVLSPAGHRVDVVIYPDPTMAYSAPVDGGQHDLARDRIRTCLVRASQASAGSSGGPGSPEDRAPVPPGRRRRSG